MSLSAGMKLGPYEILSPIGAGGMGEVWKARDTRLDRTVAVKVSRSQFNERFDREARAVAALNHPHICTLHDVGPDYLVMEFVDGKPLAGPLPLDEGLRYGIQIADALDAAHRKGVVHRDLKPANILITKTGVKLLDFGLAKITRTGAPTDTTVTIALTKENTILGTLQYMSPEQLQGKDADARSDIFSLGCVLYEMFTGRHAFEGTNAASLITAVMTAHPPSLTAAQPVFPPSLDHLIATCLAKDPEERRQTAHDVLLELRWLAGASGQAATPIPAAPPSRRSFLWPALAMVLLLSTLAFAGLYWRTAPARNPAIRFTVDSPPKSPLSPTRFGSAEISPDGLHIALLTSSIANEGGTLWIRSLDSTQARSLAGTEGAGYPFWSADSRQIGFFADGKLKRVSVEGGPPLTLCDAPNGRGGTWHGAADGVIVFAAGNTEGLSRVSAAGGQPVHITALDPAQRELSHRVPHFLPDGRHFLYVSVNGENAMNRIMVGELNSGAAKPAPGGGKRLMNGDTEARWASPGYLLFMRERNLMAQAFDVERLDFKGEAVPVAERIDMGGNRHTAAFSVSATGVLIYRQGSPQPPTHMAWLNRKGVEVEQIPAGENIAISSLSPDGKMAIGEKFAANGSTDLWVIDLVRGTASRFTFDRTSEREGVWSPDGKRIVYSLEHGPSFDLFVKDSGGLGEPTPLLQSPLSKHAYDWSRDGKWILYSESALAGTANRSILALPVTGERKPIELVPSKFYNLGARLSPDGRYFACSSNESGRPEVYVRTFLPESPAAGDKWQISTGGGGSQTWRSDGKELFFIASDGKLMAVPVQTGTTFQAGTPAVLFELRGTALPGPDGQRFLAAIPTQAQAQEPQQVVLNWTATLPKQK
ncbi:MAG: serine/threonine-protein kinase [Bryobacterales bacterium]|nr:serine/threonine-protein kinase [Bryobacterales bacterium]